MVLDTVVCDVCGWEIPPSSPRIHCLKCFNFDSCPKCYLWGLNTRFHSQQDHQQELRRVNGFIYPAPAIPSQRVPELPSFQGARIAAVKCALCLREDIQSSPYVRCLTCPDFYSCPACYLQGYETQSHGPHTHRQELWRAKNYDCTAPTLPSAEVPWLFGPSPLEAVARSFYGDLVTPAAQPLPMLSRLTGALFDYIDASLEPRNTGTLSPKKFYHTLELMGASPAALASIFARAPPTSQAAYLERRFQLFGLHFLLDEDTDPPTPLLSRRGFTAEVALSIAIDPHLMNRRLNRALAYLRLRYTTEAVGPSMGLPFYNLPIPRGCFPTLPDAAAVAKANEVDRMLREEMGDGQSMLRKEIEDDKNMPWKELEGGNSASKDRNDDRVRNRGLAGNAGN